MQEDCENADLSMGKIEFRVTRCPFRGTAGCDYHNFQLQLLSYFSNETVMVPLGPLIVRSEIQVGTGNEFLNFNLIKK